MNNFSGIVEFCAIGAYCEEFISRLISENVTLRGIREEKGAVYAEAGRRDYLKIARIAAECGVRTQVIGRKGLYFRLYRYRARYGLIIGLVLSAALLLVMERFLWKIEIHGNDVITENQVLTVLADSGIYPGAPLLTFDVNDAEVQLKRRIPRISWVNVDLNGSALNVNISEADELAKKGVPLKTPCNIVAGKTGTIVETQVYAGTLLYPVGSGVAEGSVIVSGMVNDGAEHLFISHANAKIIAEFAEKVSFSMKYTTEEKQPTGKTETEKELNLFGFVIPLTRKVESTENKLCDEYTSAYDLCGIKLPWKVKTYTYTEYENISVTRKTEDIVRILEQRLEEYCENFFSDCEIVDTEKTLTAAEDGITLDARVILRGDIAVEREIW